MGCSDRGNPTPTSSLITQLPLKLGNFTVSFTDLEIPVSGIPISVTRTYDSLNAAYTDDFGYGWRLEFRDTDLRTSLYQDETYDEADACTLGFSLHMMQYWFGHRFQCIELNYGFS